MVIPDAFQYRLVPVAMEDIARIMPRDGPSPLYRLLIESEYHSSNLPCDIGLLRRKVELSTLSFERPEFPRSPLWMFVLKDADGHIVGTSLIQNVRERLCYEIFDYGEKTHGIISARDESGLFELGGLLLAKEARGKWLAKLLSYGRVLWALLSHMKINRLCAEFLLYARGYEERGKDPYFWRTVASKVPPPNSYHDVECFWRVPGNHLRFAQILPPRIDPGLTYGDLAHCPSIHPTSEAARFLLEKIGLRYGGKVEADGSLWIEAPWGTVKQKIERVRMRMRKQFVRKSDFLDGKSSNAAIAAWLTEDGRGFEARYIPLIVCDDGESLSLGPDQSEIPEHAEIFLL